jgi:hypothetical protein
VTRPRGHASRGRTDTALQVRAGEEHLVATAGDEGDAPARRSGTPVYCGGRRGCLAPVAAYHDGAVPTGLVAAEDGTWLERTRGLRSRGARPRAGGARPVSEHGAAVRQVPPGTEARSHGAARAALEGSPAEAQNRHTAGTDASQVRLYRSSPRGRAGAGDGEKR